jgi:hypothetical protein
MNSCIGELKRGEGCVLRLSETHDEERESINIIY